MRQELTWMQARRAEEDGHWAKAAKLWRSIGRIEDAEACELIVDSTAKGDAYRAEVLRVAGPEPEVDGDKTDSIKWMTWYKAMEQVYTNFKNKHYEN